MNNTPNWAQIVSAVGGLAGFTALLVELWSRKVRRKRPPDGLLDGLLWLQDTFGDVLANGGRESLWFLDPERRRQENLLAILAGQIVDDDLNSLVGTARMNYGSLFPIAPGHGTLNSSHNVKRIEKQIQYAGDGRTACTKAIDRANKLIRDYQK